MRCAQPGVVWANECLPQFFPGPQPFFDGLLPEGLDFIAFGETFHKQIPVIPTAVPDRLNTSFYNTVILTGICLVSDAYELANQSRYAPTPYWLQVTHHPAAMHGGVTLVLLVTRRHYSQLLAAGGVREQAVCH